MLDFILTYWREILEVVLLLATFLVALFKKVKVANPSILALIDELLPTAIKYVEETCGSGNGAEKKELCIDWILKTVKGRFADVNVERFKKYVGERIELILSTPQKKG